MKLFWTLMLASLVMFLSAMPVIACDSCNKDGPVFGITALDNDMVYQPVMAANEITMPSPYAVPVGDTMLVPVAIIDPGSVDQRARHVRPKSNILVTVRLTCNMPCGEGVILLRQGGKPAVT